MKRESTSSSLFLHRHFVTLLTVLALAFILQTGLIPFDFFSSTDGNNSFFVATTDAFTYPDIVSNIFLYVPAGFFLAWTFLRSKRGIRPYLLAVFAAASLSACIEFLQAYSPSRVSSLIDLVSNSLGGALGAILFFILRHAVPPFYQRLGEEFHARPLATAVKVYGLFLVFMAALPFSFSLDVGLFKRSLKTSTWIPFEGVQAYNEMADDAAEAGDARRAQYARWFSLKRWSRWTAETVSFALLVWLVVPILLTEYRFTRRGALAMAWWLCGGFGLLLCLIQLPLVTRDFDITDVLFRFAGIAIGLFTRFRYLAGVDQPNMVLTKGLIDKLAPWAAGGSVVYIFYIGLLPFRFDPNHAGLSRAIESHHILPFFAYFVTRFDVMMDDVMEKFVAYAVFAASLSMAWTRCQGWSVWQRGMTLGGIGAVISVPIELVQSLMPVRVTSLTDPVVAGMGCLAGAVAQQCLAVMLRQTEKQEETPRSQDELPPADAILATLGEPRPDAPREPGGAPRSTPQN